MSDSSSSSASCVLEWEGHARSARNLPDGGPRAGVAPESVPTELMAADGSVSLPPYEILPTPQDIVAPTGAGWTAATSSSEFGRRVAELLDDRIVEVLGAEFPRRRSGPS